MDILLIDNDDSFTYNLVQLIKSAGANVVVVSHNTVEIEQCEIFEKIVFSPGPDLPSKYPAMTSILTHNYKTKSILGICLGHQTIAEFFGCKLKRVAKPHHGEKSKIKILNQDGIYKDIPQEFSVGRYHSWVVDNINAEEIEVTAIDDNNEIMSLRHKRYNISGLQYHPESYMTEYGLEIIRNWIYRI